MVAECRKRQQTDRLGDETSMLTGCRREPRACKCSKSDTGDGQGNHHERTRPSTDTAIREIAGRAPTMAAIAPRKGRRSAMTRPHIAEPPPAIITSPKGISSGLLSQSDFVCSITSPPGPNLNDSLPQSSAIEAPTTPSPASNKAPARKNAIAEKTSPDPPSSFRINV
jgi:hypothetical protein